MLTLLFIVGMVYLTVKLIVMGVKATWNIFKFLGSLLIPVFLVALVIAGIRYIAIPVLILAVLVIVAMNAKE